MNFVSKETSTTCQYCLQKVSTYYKHFGKHTRLAARDALSKKLKEHKKYCEFFEMRKLCKKRGPLAKLAKEWLVQDKICKKARDSRDIIYSKIYDACSTERLFFK